MSAPDQKMSAACAPAHFFGRGRGARLAALSLAGFGGLEALAATLAPAPGGGIAGAEWSGWIVLLGALGAALGSHPWGLRWGPALWCAAVWPHAARVAGWDALGWPLVGLALGLGLLPRRWAWAATAGSALLTPLAVERPAQAPAPSGAVTDIALVTVDTVRADAVQSALGENFTQITALAAAPWTLPSVYSLMLGQPVQVHRGGLFAEGGTTAPDPSLPWLAEQLSAQGRVSAAFVCNPHLRAEYGFDRGFHRFEHSDDWIEPAFAAHSFFAWRRRLGGQVERLRAQRDTRLMKAALAWWSEHAGQARFLWVHLLAPHEHTRDPAPHTAAPGEDPRRAAYRASAAAGWAQAEALARGLVEAEVVVLTSDHGEALGEGGRWGHGRALQAAQLEVPLVARGLPVEEGPGSYALAELAPVLTGGSPALRPRAEVWVGGLRRSPDEAGRWTPAGLVQEPPPEPTQATRPGAALEAELRALGYY